MAIGDVGDFADEYVLPSPLNRMGSATREKLDRTDVIHFASGGRTLRHRRARSGTNQWFAALSA